MGAESRVDEFDYVVVGGGSAGAVLARRLADDPSVTVCLLEAGPDYEDDAMVLELKNSFQLWGDPAYDFDYGIAAQERGNSLIRMSRGRMLGGCSSHNDCFALRAPDADMDRWEAAGATGWNAASTAGHFDRIFRELHVHDVTRTAALSLAVVEASRALGMPVVDNATGDYRTGISWLQMNEREGRRVSTAVGYLFPLADLPENLVVRCETPVERIVISDGRATGAKTAAGVVAARREVILSAGAIDSPRLLMLSGIGPAAHLRDAGVDVVLDLPGVGQNLQDHIETPIIWESAREAGESTHGVDLAVYASLLDDSDFDVQMGSAHFSYWLSTEPFASLPQVDRAFMMAPNVARPRSTGSVTLDVANPHGDPVIDPRYFTDDDNHDERLLVEGLKLARRLAETAALRDWVVREIAPGPEVVSDEDLATYARRYSNTVYHPTSTCRMGAVDDATAVVDPRLRVRGVRGLRVADASIFPEVTRVNPNMTAVMVGSKAAELISADHAKPQA